LGKFGQKSFVPQNLPAPTSTMKTHLRPHCPPLKGQRDKCPRHASILWHPCAYYSTGTLFTRCCRLQLLTVMNVNYQRYPKTEQLITAKVSSNALKQRSTTHSVLRLRSSQLQKYKAARMSRRIAVDQKVCSRDDGHPGLTVWNLLNYTRIENAHEVFVFWYVAVICTITGGTEQIRACVSRYDQSAWNAN